MEDSISAFLKYASEKKFQQLAKEFQLQYDALISKAGGMLSPESLDGIRKALKEGKLCDVMIQIQKVFSAAENAGLEVAVIGESGTGKSSFINALRGVGHEAEESADVGTVETTKCKIPYQHPKYPKVIFWDLPGTGTPDFHIDTYLDKVGFANYDFFVIVSSSRFSLNDALLAKKIQDAGKKFYFVRTKVDSDLDNEKITKPTTFKEENVLQRIQDYCLDNLMRIGVTEPHIFLISNFDLDRYDYPKLEETLLKELPGHKRHKFALLLPSISDASIELKKHFLQEKIYLEVLKSASKCFILGISAIFRFDLPKQEQCLKEYRSYFGLDDTSIGEIARKLDTPLVDIKGELKCLDFWSLVKDDSITAKATRVVEVVLAMTGDVVSSVFQALKVYYRRTQFLNVVVDDAKNLLRKMEKANVP